MQTDILSPSSGHIELAAAALRRGQLVAMPTETVYGLAGHGLDTAAVAQIFAVKERPHFNPLILHLAPAIPLEKLQGWLLDLAEFTPAARERLESLCTTFWPGPLTLVLPKSAVVPDLVSSGLPTVALRVPAHPVAQALLQAVQMPLAAPSANRFGRISPTSAQAVYAELSGRIPYILDGGNCSVGLESTVLKLSPEGIPTLLRPGGIPVETLEAHLGLRIRLPADWANASTHSEGLESPGQLRSHYAPNKPLFLLPARVLQLQPADWQPIQSQVSGHAHVGILGFARDPEKLLERLQPHFAEAILHLELLDPDPSLAAPSLFDRLRHLDEGSATLLLAEPPPLRQGLGHAIMDRLRRASTPWNPPPP
ncbi:threonylcarbamoyl-AMP synthase [Synechococcus sp. Nb3U1]|uniref:L-threonylcarbamoyladenylate synthase n=1 Tax=Synechococcus sp. Nb3U1 TaxID=1914529 RepID=UPI001F42E285|nr:L-threonylcarbamoyladenylate synthase [Synechococcus sp. Nb3U1]MCF2971440.1 threonylcarbamoyl-AMP synthase [Synechococcus sp. Nb3U1]